MKSPIVWVGGKAYLVAKLLLLLPQHTHYVEVFGGGASLLFAKPPSQGIEVYNDLDNGLVNFFRVLKNEEKFEKFYRLVALTPYSREEFYNCKKTFYSNKDDIEYAYKFFVLSKQAFGGDFAHGWGYVCSTVCRSIAATTSKWLSGIENLSHICARLLTVQIENQDFRKIIEVYNKENTLLYVDPPYVHSTRKSFKYKIEMTDNDHKDLINSLIEYPQKVMISGYNNSIYSKLDNNGWKRYDFEANCFIVGKTRETRNITKESKKRIESVWLNKKAIIEKIKYKHIF